MKKKRSAKRRENDEKPAHRYSSLLPLHRYLSRRPLHVLHYRRIGPGRPSAVVPGLSATLKGPFSERRLAALAQMVSVHYLRVLRGSKRTFRRVERNRAMAR
jgi:hypothetical protein